MRNINKKNVAESFSMAAATYDGHVPAQKYVAAALFGHVSRFLPEPCGRVADAGCGTGFLSRMLRESLPQAQLVCVDIAPGMIAACRENLGETDIRYVVGDLEQPCFGEGFDLIVSSYALQWTHLARALDNLCRALAHSGVLALALPVAGSFPELAQAYRIACGRELPGPDYPPADTVREMLRGLGMEELFAQVEDFTAFFPTAREVLRSFKRCGAAFHRHEEYEPLRVEEVKRMLEVYDYELRARKNRVGLTFRTLYCILRKGAR